MIQVIKQFPILTVLFVVAVIASVRADSLEVPSIPAELAVLAGSDGLLAATTFIQRLETVAGIAPTDGCSEAALSQEARIPYTATYYFYQAK
jgi:hypothetical protein